MSDTITYTISSDDRINSVGGLVNHYIIPFGGFGQYRGEYECQVKQFVYNGYVRETLGYIQLTAENLHSSGYHSNNPSSECVVAVSPSELLLNTTQRSSFNVANCTTKRNITFTMRGPNYTPLNNADINIDGNSTRWFLVLHMIPIKETHLI